MEQSLKNKLAEELGDCMKALLSEEGKWEAFKSAAEEVDIDPYVALGRLLATVVEETLEEPHEGNGRH